MKKNLLLYIFIITIILSFCHRQLYNKYKVYKVKSPDTIFVDYNRNYIFDENLPLLINDVFFIKTNYNLNQYPILRRLTNVEKLFLELRTIDFAKKNLENKFVVIKNNKIYINNKKYSQMLLDANLVFNENEETQKSLIESLNKFNLNEYFVYNIKTKKFQSLEQASNIILDDYKLIHVSQLEKFGYKKISINNIGIISSNNKKNINLNNKLSYLKKYNIEIFFQDLNTIYKPNLKCNSLACLTLKREIDNAKYSIDFAIYGMNNQPEIFNSLLNAQKRGVKIRWISDFDKKASITYPDIYKLKRYIKNFRTDEEYEKNNSSAIMHNKFFIFDKDKVWTGSSNLTSTDMTGFNANYSILIKSKEAADIFTREFNQMYNGQSHTKKIRSNKQHVSFNNDIMMKILFSPQDNIIENEIIPIILNAKKYIYIPIFFITHQNIKNALIKAHNNGVEIKIINDATNAHSKYSIHKDLRKAGIKVKTENYAGKMHMKAMFIDDKISIIGSMNLTKSANIKNDENVLIIYNEKITQYFKETFLYLWNKIPNKYEYFDPRAESFESIGSCYDGIDNNFDNKIDEQDVGCFQKI